MQMAATREPILTPIKTKPSDAARISFRRLSHDVPPTDTSFSDIYYRANPAGVPFLWESRPGTPKFKSREFPVPPLTPPPSFHSSPAAGIHRKQAKIGLISAALLPKLNLSKKAKFQRSPSSKSWSSSLSSPPWSSSPSPLELKQRRIRRSAPSCDSGAEESDEFESPVSTLCFGCGRGGEERRQRGCSLNIMKLFMGDF